MILYKQDNGAVAIVRPTEEALLEYGIDAIAEKDIPAGVPYRIVNGDEVPSDRTFRNAWYDENGIKVDMQKAVEITKDRLRAERAPLLAIQDTLFQRAQETGAATVAIVAEKVRLRDVTKLADKPGITLAELKELTAG